MFGIGFGELLVISALLLIAVGPRRMPTMMKTVGRALREFRRATRELRAQTGIDELLAEDDVMRPKSMSSTRSQLQPAGTRTPLDAARHAAAVVVAAEVREYPAEGVDLAESGVSSEPTPEPTPKVEA